MENERVVPFEDLSDKGRKQNKRLRYEVGVFYCVHPENEAITIIAKFSCYSHAFHFAQKIRLSPDFTLITLRS